jgi:hypothetical protein
MVMAPVSATYGIAQDFDRCRDLHIVSETNGVHLVLVARLATSVHDNYLLTPTTIDSIKRKKQVLGDKLVNRVENKLNSEQTPSPLTT